MSRGDHDIIKKIVESGDTPFDIVNADGDHFSRLKETHVESLNHQILEEIQNKILNIDRANFWAAIAGDYGSGKTHLCQMIKDWTKENRVFCFWVNNYYGKNFFLRNLLSALVYTPGFTKDNSISVLQEMFFPLLKRTISNVLSSGPDWPQKICPSRGFFPWKIYNQEKHRKNLRKMLENPENFVQLIQELDQDKLQETICLEYKEEIKETKDSFVLLMKIVFADQQQQRIALKKLQGEENSPDTEMTKTHLVEALCLLITHGKIPVCMILDQFETMYYELLQPQLEKSDDKEMAEEKFKAVINNLFGIFEDFFHKTNIAVLFSCPDGNWKVLHNTLRDSITRRIQNYRMRSPGDEEIVGIVKKRIKLFCREKQINELETLFTPKPETIKQIILESRRRLPDILKELRIEFLSRIKSLIEDDFPDLHKKQLTAIRQQLGEMIKQQQEIFEKFDEKEKTWLEQYKEECRLFLDKIMEPAPEPIIPRDDKDFEIQQLQREIRELREKNDDLSREIIRLEEIIGGISPPDPNPFPLKDRTVWYRLLRTQSFTAASMRDALENRCGLENTKECGRVELVDLIIEKMTDRQIFDMMRTYYDIADLNEMEERNNIGKSRSKENAMKNILQAKSWHRSF